MAISYYPKAILVCLTGGVLVGYQFLLQGIPGLMVQPLEKVFSINLTQVGVLSGSMLYLYLLLQGYSGIMARRFGEKRCLVTALLFMGLLCIVFANVTNYATGIIVRMLMGVCSAPGVICAMMLISRWFPDKWFALITGLWEGLNMVITSTGPGMLGEFVIKHGWQSAMYLLAATGFFLAVLNFLFVKNNPAVNISETTPLLSEQKENSINSNTKEKYMLTLVKQPFFIALCIFCFSLFSIISTFACLWGVSFMKALYPENPVWATQSIALVFIGVAVGAPVTGAVASYFNRPRLVMFYGATVHIICFVLLIYVPVSIAFAGLLLFLLGASCSVYMLPFALARKLFTINWLYSVSALLNFSCIVTAPLLQPVIGKLLAIHSHEGLQLNVSDYRFAFLPLLIILCLALLSLVWIREESRATSSSIKNASPCSDESPSH